MNRAIDQRLRRLEAEIDDSGPRVLLSAFPLPRPRHEAEHEVSRLLSTGKAILSRNGVLYPAKTLTSEEWIEQCGPRGRELPT
jgi:hypothetical protein